MSDSLSTKFIEIQGVEQTFKTRKGPFCALRDINLEQPLRQPLQQRLLQRL